MASLSGPPPWPLAFRLAHQIAMGMEFLHSHSPTVLHLDLKPSNVLLDDRLNAKAINMCHSKNLGVFKGVPPGSNVSTRLGIVMELMKICSLSCT
ncbi:unnamed protein product [Coregonus sp. 'balchen']|nr:unnamed protein product [Coregonus sp. 'balchen']